MTAIRSLAAPLLFALASAPAIAQQPLMEKIDVSIVNVDVTVTAHGQPIRGLTAKDFEVLEDGKPQTISSFFAVEPEPPRPAPAAAATVAPALTTPAASDDRARRKVLLIVDYLHTSKIERNRALAHLQEFVAERYGSGAYEWSIMIVGLSTRTILPLTTDSERARAAIEALRNDELWQPAPDTQPISLDVRLPDADPNEAAGNPRYSWAAFNAVRSGLRGFAALEGKKIVLLLTNGFGKAFEAGPAMMSGVSSGNAAAVVAGVSGHQLFTMRDHLIREANAANVNFYVIDASGLQSTGTKGSLYWLARETGGTFFGGNYVDASLTAFESLSSNFYSLAYRPPHADDGKYHRITVRLKRPGSYRLQYRDGYGTLPLEARLERILTTPAAALLAMQHSAIALAINPGQPRSTGAATTMVPLRVTLPLQNLQFMPARRGSEARIDFFISVFEDGRSVGVQRYTTKAHANNGENTEAGVMTYDALVRMRPGRQHTVVVAVHDQASDALGYAVRDVGFQGGPTQ